MNRFYQSLAALMLLLATGGMSPLWGQLTGTINVPGAYPDLQAAIADLNLQGVGAGGVVINLLPGNPQTAPAGGYAITATGTVANPIVIAGNSNMITASTGHTVGALNDAVFKIIGSDFITLTGFSMQEDPANTVTAAATNNMTEFGVALFYASATDGCQDVSIVNNQISLNRTYQNTFGIYSNSTHTATAVTTSATATGALGGNHNLKIYGNQVSNVNIGIVVVGPTVAADHNQTIDIGGTAALTGNTISNFGTTGTFSNYANVSGTVNGILVRNSTAINISNNSITSSSGGTTSGTLRGIFIPAFSNAPVGTFSHTINNNTLSIQSGAAGGSVNGIIVEGTTGTATSSLLINNNQFTQLNHSVAGTGAITAISNAFAYLNVDINSNAFVNLSTNTTGNFTFITNSVAHPAGGVQNVNNNAIQTGFSKTGAGGTVTLYFTNSTSGATVTQNNNSNNFSNITLTGATVFEGWRNTDGGSPVKNIQNNIVSNIIGGTGTVTGMFVSFSGNSNVNNNQIFNITNGAAITGISTGSGIDNFTNNTIHSLTGTGTGAVTGFAITGGTTKVLTGNKIYNLENTNAGGVVFGISSTGSTTATLVNNLVGDLRAPNVSAANAVIGINITGGTTVNAFYNSVHINAVSIGANFGSSAISASSTPNVTLRNNIFINKSTPNGTGLAVAYRRSTTTLTSYNAASNNNLFYAGTPGVNNLIFFDGTNSDQLLADFQTRVATRDALSVTEDVAFLSLTGSSANFLRINPVTPSFAESGASNIAGITTDYDNVIRGANTGYSGTGTAPDMGALEFEGSNPNSCSGTPAAANAVSSSSTVCPSANFTLSLSTSYSGAGFTYQWQSSPDGSLYTNISGATSDTYVAAQTSATFYQCIITCFNSGQSTISTPVEVTMSSLFACYCAPTYTSGCGTGDAITNVTLADLNNASGCAASPYYTFFNTVTVPALARTTQYTVNVSFGTDGSQFAGVWIDYNQDGDFADAGEFVGNNTVSAGANGTTSITFTIPAGATIGQTMMRIRGGNDSQLGNTPCGASSSGFGETEDYLVNIVDMPADPPVPVQDPAAPTCTAGADLSVPGTPNPGEAWFWQTSATGTSTANPVSGPYTVFQNGTYFVRTYNATFNLWSVNSTSVTVSNIPVAVAPPAPVAAASPACLSTTISVAAPVDPNVTYFWQGTVSNGVDNTQDAVNPYTVTASGTYYVSSFDVSTGCWSDGVGVVVQIDTYVPDAPTAASPFDYCVGVSSAIISATPPSSGQVTASFGANLLSPGTAVNYNTTLPALPLGAIITSANLEIIGANAVNGSWRSEIRVALSGAVTLAPTQLSALTSGGLITPDPSIPIVVAMGGGAVTLTLTETYDDPGVNDATFNEVRIVVNYSLPASTITWYDAASGPAQIGTGNTLESIGTTTLPNGNTPGTYSFYAQSESGACSSLTRAQVDVVINPFSATVTAVDVTCNGANNGTFTVTAPNCGTAPYEYAVDGGAYTSTIPSNLTPGAHTVMVRDDNGFETALYSITITQPAQLIASETHVDVLCNGAATGSIDVTITGGTAPYSFTWSNGAIGEDQTGIVAGTYNLVVTDDRGCNAFASVNITQPTAIVVAETHNNLNCNSDASGSIDLSVSGGIAPYTY
ncbi:MAG: beta strand repeat-containing protein, partial [Flavobacteriales bacterium]